MNLIIAAVAFASGMVFLRDGHRPERVRSDIAGTVTVVLGLVGIVCGLGSAETHGWNDVRTIGPVIAGVALVAVFVLIERRTEHPLLSPRVILDRVRGTAYLSLGISGIGMFVVFLFLSHYLENTLGFTPLQTGMAFLPMIGSVMAGAVFSGAVLLPRTGPRPLVPAGCVLSAIGMATPTGIRADSSYAGAVLPALLVTGIGFGLIFGPVQNAATSGVRSHDTGVAAAMVTAAQQIGGSIGTAVFSSLATTATATHLSTHAATAAQPATITEATPRRLPPGVLERGGDLPEQRCPGCASLPKRLPPAAGGLGRGTRHRALNSGSPRHIVQRDELTKERWEHAHDDHPPSREHRDVHRRFDHRPPAAGRRGSFRMRLPAADRGRLVLPAPRPTRDLAEHRERRRQGDGPRSPLADRRARRAPGRGVDPRRGQRHGLAHARPPGVRDRSGGVRGGL